MDFRLEFFPRPGYAAGAIRIIKEDNVFRFSFKKEVFSLGVSISNYNVQHASDEKISIDFSLKEKESAHFDFVYGDRTTHEVICSFEETKKFWLGWLHNCVGDRCSFFGEYTDMINRSLLVLKLLTFQPTGAIAAAATTSIPEVIGGERNWDYRFTWIRDASFTLKAMFALGHIEEADSFISWLHNTYKIHGGKNLQIMYSLKGKSNLTETVLTHLKGYKDSKPVRVGNNAFNQRQLDIYGEVMDAALRLSDYAGKIDEGLWPFFRDICELAVKNWKKPDEGIWEVRSRPMHFVYSKVMCWVALDRGIKIARRYGFDAPLNEWQNEANKIKQDVLEKGFDKNINSFVQSYGSIELDSSLLLIGLVGFLPIHDPRMQGTIENCKRRLMREGFLLRYSGGDGLKGEEGAFILCNFWLIECLVLSERLEEAKEILTVTTGAANHLGLFSEEHDYRNKEMLGNFPQAFSHIGYINAVTSIFNRQIKDLQKKMRPPSLLKRIERLAPYRVVLNKSDVGFADATVEIADELKILLNKLQGAFFDASEGRVDYQAMKSSDSYRKYLSLAKKLNSFDPFSLKEDNEKKAFWINIYNILIIHGVIELDIQRSVLEVFRFFARIGYMIGGLYFTPDDIEHGILRANRPNPSLNKKEFHVLDKRRSLCVKAFDPRIHFALVCASSSCPPIEFYHHDNIGRQLDLSARSFINRGGVTLDESKNILYLSQIFKWYEKDFGKDVDKTIDYLSNFTKPKIVEYININRSKLKIKYIPYNWDLNKTLG